MANNQNIQYTISLRDLVSPALRTVENNANQLEGTLGKLKGAAIAAFAGWGIKEAIQGIVQAGASVEATRIGLTNMLGSAYQAGEVIKNTMIDAAATPFDFEGLLKANKMLIGAQVEATQARKDVLNLANAIASTGGGNDELNRMVLNLTQIKNVGAATAVDIKQFAFANINIYRLLADQLGITTDKLKSKLEDGLVISYENITKALQKAHDAGGLYAGGLEAMSEATTVKMSAITDALFQLKVKIFDDLKPTIDKVVDLTFKFIGALSSLWDWIVRNREMIGLFVTVLAGAAAGILAIMAPIYIVIAAIRIWIYVQGLLNIVMNANPIAILIVAIAALVAGVIYAYNHFSKFRGIMWATAAVIKEVVSIITDHLKGLYNVFMGVLTLDDDQIIKGYKQLESSTFGAFKRIGDAAKSGYSAGVKDFYDDNPVKQTYGYNAPQVAIKSKNGGPPPGGDASKATGTSKVAGQKVLNITIHIGNLINDFKVVTTNMTEGSAKIKDMVTQVLLSAVNDSQIVPEK